MNCVLILGTAREESYSKKVASFLREKVEQHKDFTCVVLDVQDMHQMHTGSLLEKENEIKSIFKSADAYVVVSPEYNRGYPGELKMFLDSFYTEYIARPVGFCGVSSGSVGGARAVEQLKLVALDLNLIPIHTHLYVSTVQERVVGDVFDGDYLMPEVTSFLDELAVYGKNLLELRKALMGNA